MSTDFFADLERQLVDATPRRRRRLRRARARRVASAAGALTALAAVVVALGATLGGGDRERRVPPRPAAPARPAAPGPAAADAPVHGTVAVLNATTMPGLARGVATRLQRTGVKIGNVTNDARQDASATVVTYAPGHVRAAIRVAARLQLGDTVLRPATSAERAIGGHQAAVIVVVGADQVR
jgi:LytR cell envelope-related transcriptional attenuator